jgi:transcription-repair coupling factor (superfamily II helicase)
MQTTSEIRNLIDLIKKGKRIISLSGLTSISAKSYVLTQLQNDVKKTFVVVTDSNNELEVFENDVEFFNSKFQIPNSKLNESDQSGIWNTKSGILSLPSFEIDIYSSISPHAETLERRALALWNLTISQPSFLLISAKSLITKVLSPSETKNLGANLQRDKDFSPENLIEKLESCGYVREEPLKNVGEFSVRGGIIDVWSPDAENPVRIEFFDDTVDSIREFNAETQLSIQQLKEISLAPMREFSANSQDFKDWSFFANERFADERFARNLKDRAQFAVEGESFAGWEFLINLVKPRTSSIFDYLKDCVFVIDEPVNIEHHLGEFYENITRRFAEINEHDEIGLEPNELFLSAEELRKKLSKLQRLELRALGSSASKIDEEFAV